MASRILYVEGKNDLHVVANICNEHDVVEFDIKESGNVEQLLDDVPTVVKSELAYADAIGMVIDADMSLADRWRSISSRLEQVGYEGLPPSPEAGGLVMGPRTDLHLPTVGVWIMPNNQDDGALEDFLALLVPQGNEDWGHAEACVSALGSCRFSPSDRKKAVLYTWLAWRETPGQPYGRAIGSRSFDVSAEPAVRFARWLQQLFGDQAHRS